MRDHNSDNEENAHDDEDYQNMSTLKRKYIRRKDSDQSMNSQYLKRGEDLYQDYLDRKRKEQMLRKKKQVGMKNTKLRARKLDASKDYGNTSSTSISKMINPAAAGGLLGARKFGMGLGANINKQNPKAYQYGKTNKLLLEESTSDVGYDDNMSEGGIIRIGGQSEYSQDQSFLSIRQYESSDGGDSQIYRNDSDSSMAMTDIKRNQSNWDGQSDYSDGNIIVIGDANSSFQSSAMSETTIRQMGGSQNRKNRPGGLKSRLGARSRVQSSYGGNSSHIIVDDASQGYGLDSEIDAQEMINQMGDPNPVYIEDNSDIIDEDDEGNYSFDNLRRKQTVNTKKNKSLDDFDGEQQEDPVNQQDFLKGLMTELTEKPQRASFKARPPQLQEVDDHEYQQKVKTPINPLLIKLDSNKYIPKGQEIFHEQSDEEGSDNEQENNFQRGQRRSVKRRITIDVQNTDSSPINHQAFDQQFDERLEQQQQDQQNDSNLDNQSSQGSIKLKGNSFEDGLNNISGFSDGEMKTFGLDSRNLSQIDDPYVSNLSGISDVEEVQ